MTWLIAGFGVLCAFMAAFATAPDKFPGGVVVMQRLRDKATVSDRLAQYESNRHSKVAVCLFLNVWCELIVEKVNVS